MTMKNGGELQTNLWVEKKYISMYHKIHVNERRIMYIFIIAHIYEENV